MGNLDLWLDFKWDLANILKGADIYVVPAACPQGEDDNEPSPETGSIVHLVVLTKPQVIVLIKQIP